MTKNDHESPDPEDMFNETRMSFGDHIGELRTHLLRALKGFVLGMLVSLFVLGKPVLLIIIKPLEDQLEQFEKRVVEKEILISREKNKDIVLSPISMEIMFNRNDLLKALGQSQEKVVTPPPTDKMVKGFEDLLIDLDAIHLLEKEVRQEGQFVRIQAQIPNPESFTEGNQRSLTQMRRPRVSTMNITEAFMVYFKVAMMTGFVISSPWVFYHVWAFIAAGLYPTEKRLVNIYLPFSLFLFISGVLVCQFMVMPKAIEAMLWFNEWLGLAADLRLNEWLGFALMMPLVFGLSFQTPLVMMFLHKVGIISVETYRARRRISWFLMAVFAAVITPSVDAFSMLFLWVPMGALYELGILLCVYQGREEMLAEWETEENKSSELVEV